MAYNMAATMLSYIIIYENIRYMAGEERGKGAYGGKPTLASGKLSNACFASNRVVKKRGVGNRLEQIESENEASGVVWQRAGGRIAHFRGKPLSSRRARTGVVSAVALRRASKTRTGGRGVAAKRRRRVMGSRRRTWWRAS